MTSRISSTVGLVLALKTESDSKELSTLPSYEPPFGQEANAALAPLEPLKRPKNDDPSLAEAVDALKKGENVRIPGLLDERIEECGPNRNCYAAVQTRRLLGSRRWRLGNSGAAHSRHRRAGEARTQRVEAAARGVPEPPARAEIKT